MERERAGGEEGGDSHRDDWFLPYDLRNAGMRPAADGCSRRATATRRIPGNYLPRLRATQGGTFQTRLALPECDGVRALNCNLRVL